MTPPPNPPLFPYTTLFRSPVTSLLSALVAIFVATKVLGELAQRLGQPAVLGELIAGVLLGKSVLGIVDPSNAVLDRKSTRLNSSHPSNSYAVFCLKKKTIH